MGRRYRIAVVGCGVAGAAAGTLLARGGHDVHVYEQTPRVGPVGAGVLLQPAGQEVLLRMGLLDAVVARAERVETLQAQTHRGRTLIDLRYDEHRPGLCAYGVHRADLFGVLHEALVNAGARLHLGNEIRQLESLDERAFDAVLLCDGARSRSRDCCRGTRLVHTYAQGALWAIGRCEAVRGRLHQVTHGTRRICGLLPMGGGRCSLFWTLGQDERQGLYDSGFDAWRRDVVTLCPPAAEMFEHVQSFEQTMFTTYRHVHQRQWSDGRRMMLGDAAHAMSPHLGQGVSLALLDAEALANAIRHTTDIPCAFRACQAARRRHVRLYGSLSALVTPFFQSRGWAKALGREIALPLMTRVSVVRRAMVHTMTGLRADLIGGDVP